MISDITFVFIAVLGKLERRRLEPRDDADPAGKFRNLSERCGEESVDQATSATAVAAAAAASVADVACVSCVSCVSTVSCAGRCVDPEPARDCARPTAATAPPDADSNEQMSSAPLEQICTEPIEVEPSSRRERLQRSDVPSADSVEQMLAYAHSADSSDQMCLVPTASSRC